MSEAIELARQRVVEAARKWWRHDAGVGLKEVADAAAAMEAAEAEVSPRWVAHEFGIKDAKTGITYAPFEDGFDLAMNYDARVEMLTLLNAAPPRVPVKWSSENGWISRKGVRKFEVLSTSQGEQDAVERAARLLADALEHSDKGGSP